MRCWRRVATTRTCSRTAVSKEGTSAAASYSISCSTSREACHDRGRMELLSRARKNAHLPTRERPGKRAEAPPLRGRGVPTHLAAAGRREEPEGGGSS